MFENLIMLAGLGGAAVPLVIHLLSRTRYRTVPWGAMMFIETGSSRGPTPYAGKLRERVLLAMRMAVVGLLAVALARPVAGQLAARSSGPAVQPASIAAVLVVDCSASMAHEDAGGTRMALARQAALRILSTFRRGDQVCLIPVGGVASSPGFTGDLQSVATRVAEIKPLAGGANFEAALNQAADALERQEGAEKRIYIVCDTQAASWASIDEDVAAALRQRLRNASARVIATRVGSDDVENLAVEAITLLNPPAVAGCETQIEVRVHNFGRQERLGVPLAIRAGGRDITSTTINVAPGNVAKFITSFVPGNQPGLQTISAELRVGGAVNDPDDRLDKVVDVIAPIRTLIVRGGDRQRTPDYLSLALRNVAAVDVVKSDEWDPRKLSDYRVVIFDDAPAPTATQARLLEQFVYAGGGLLIAPGVAARIEEYNRVLYREEAGLLPALLQAPVAPPGQRIDAATFDTSHPLMSFLAAGSVAPAANVRRYLPITARTALARVLGSYTSGDPFIIESAFGAGKVVLITSGLDAQWSSFPLTNLYLPLMQSTVRRLARSSDAHNVAAGQEITVALSPPVEGNRATVQGPDGSRFMVDAAPLEDRTEIRFTGTKLPGVYSVRAGPRGKERSTMFAVAPAVGESDLTPMGAAQWAQLSDRLGFAREQIAIAPSWWAMARGTSGVGWLVALAGVLVLLVAEMWVTRSWSAPAGVRS